MEFIETAKNFRVTNMKSFIASHATFKMLVCASFAGLAFTSANAVVLPGGDHATAKTPALTAPQIQYPHAETASGNDLAVASTAPVPVTTSAPATNSKTALGFESQSMEEEVPSFHSVPFATASGAVSPSGASTSTLTPVPEMNVLFPIVGLLVAISATQFLRRRRAAQLSHLDQ